MSRSAKYVGEEPCPVMIGDRRLAKGEVVTGPADVVEYLLGRADFEAVEGGVVKGTGGVLLVDGTAMPAEPFATAPRTTRVKRAKE